MDNVELLPMTASDYDEVRALWMTIRGFGIRVLDDSREEIERFIKLMTVVSLVFAPLFMSIGSLL